MAFIWIGWYLDIVCFPRLILCEEMWKWKQVSWMGSNSSIHFSIRISRASNPRLTLCHSVYYGVHIRSRADPSRPRRRVFRMDGALPAHGPPWYLLVPVEAGTRSWTVGLQVFIHVNSDFFSPFSLLLFLSLPVYTLIISSDNLLLSTHYNLRSVSRLSFKTVTLFECFYKN